jgi:hypothetical protein
VQPARKTKTLALRANGKRKIIILKSQTTRTSKNQKLTQSHGTPTQVIHAITKPKPRKG